MILALLSALARAQQPVAAPRPPPVLHAGIPIDRVQALHPRPGRPPRDPSFGTPATGWSLIVPGGVVFVFVGRSVADAEAWTALQLSRQRSPPAPVDRPVTGVEAAWRRGTDFAMLRDDNIGIMVQGTDEASEEAALLRGLIVDEPTPWPSPPALVEQPDGSFVVDGGGALQIDWQGGRRIPGAGLRFQEAPERLIAWDRLGRAATWWRDGDPTAAPADNAANPAPR